LTTTDPIERTKAHAAQMYPSADVRTKNHRGQPVVLAVETVEDGADLIRLVRLTELDGKRASEKTI
jgi:hypothetical protein